MNPWGGRTSDETDGVVEIAPFTDGTADPYRREVRRLAYLALPGPGSA